ncbi:MAG: SDR family oxidoreductase [Desulfobacteraceae bacterium]|nr:SDR family oxidoreductase [Desulfobacteraceae bacterium]
MRLANKVALVTGSSRGIGREIALGLAREGADIIVNYHQREDAARITAKEIEDMGRRALVVQAGVTVSAEVKQLVQTSVEKLGRLDILVNNAGAFPIKPFPTVSEEEWDRVMDLDLKSVFLCCREALAPMRQQRGGTIVNIASVSGLVGALGMVPYSAAKGGVIAFTKALARELASLQITVNAIAPGIIETETALEGFPPGALEAYKTQQVPLGRLGRPEDVVGLAVFLASPEASYITGQVYAVDGGFTMQ